MKSKFLLNTCCLIFTLIMSIMNVSTCFAETPACVFMRFSDVTRFVKMDSAAILSDLVMEKLLTSGKFNLKETKFIDSDIEKLLYDHHVSDVKNAQLGIATQNFNAIFESPAFDEEKSDSIAYAEVGQIIQPEITSKIGQEHGAKYLIHGTIINLASGDQFEMISTSLLNAATLGMGSLLMATGKFGGKITSLAVQAKLNVIEAQTGKVVWQNIVVGTGSQTKFSAVVAEVGNDKLNSEMYVEALNSVADQAVKALINDIENNKLFGGEQN